MEGEAVTTNFNENVDQSPEFYFWNLLRSHSVTKVNLWKNRLHRKTKYTRVGDAKTRSHKQLEISGTEEYFKQNFSNLKVPKNSDLYVGHRINPTTTFW